MYINGYKNQEKVHYRIQNSNKCTLLDTYTRCFLTIVTAMKARELLGKHILFLRKQQGMTQNDLAFKSGLGREYISTVECGKRNISIDAIEKISSALGLPLKELFDFEESQNVSTK